MKQHRRNIQRDGKKTKPTQRCHEGIVSTGKQNSVLQME